MVIGTNKWKRYHQRYWKPFPKITQSHRVPTVQDGPQAGLRGWNWWPRTDGHVLENGAHKRLREGPDELCTVN